MKKLFLFTMICLFGLFSLNAQTGNELTPVKWINAVENEKTVDMVWSMDFLNTPLEDFETGRFDTRDWRNEGEYPWTITEDAYEGKYAMKSSCEKVDKAVSSIEVEVDVPYDGFVAFNHRISAEDNADMGNFYIDGVLKTSISGNREWRYAEVFVTAGTHTYKWEYAKDGSRHTYDDAYFVDNVTFYKEIEVEEGWIGYDDGKWATSIGPGNYNPSSTYWGVSFPTTVQYEGLTLTKIAVYDAAKGGSAQYTAYIYLGGDTIPETLVSTQSFSVTGADKMIEVELTEPVAIDGTQPLWITLFCDQLVYPVSTSLKSEHLTSDWISTDGKDWKHASEYKLYGSWMLRGYLEDASGKTRAISSEDAEFSSTYNVYRKDLYKNTVDVLAEGTADTTFTDAAWENMGTGAYQWGAAAIYDNGESDVVWSNTISKDMSTELTVEVETDSEDPVAGTAITLVNTVESEYSYSAYLGMEASCTFKDFHKGVYEVTVYKEGFSSNYDKTTVEVWDAMTLECVLTEQHPAVENLYVSPTGWAMWDGAYIGVGDEFHYDFEDCTLNGWITLDADNDNYTWQNSFEIMTPGSGHDGSIACVTSMSWFFGIVLTPDNYLVTENKYLIDETSKLKFWVSAQDAAASAEHYGVAVSLANNDKPEDFITIWEETLTLETTASNAQRGTTAQSQWYEKVVDLSEYAGQEIYIALRHFNCTDQFYLNVDDISLVSTAKNHRALQSYNVYLDGELVAEGLKTPYCQIENLEDGKEYTAEVAAVYATDESERISYSWKNTACDSYQAVADLKSEYVDGKSTISWTLPETDTEILGVMLYRNENLIAYLAQGESFVDETSTAGDEYSVRVVYDDYAMSCAQTILTKLICQAPKGLNAYSTKLGDGRIGTQLAYPYVPPTSEWLKYDNGYFIDALGADELPTFYWGVRFPAEKLEAYTGTNITKVMVYDYNNTDLPNELSIEVHYGGETSPEYIIHSQNFVGTGAGQFVEVDLTAPLPVSGEEDIWVILKTENGGSYPAAFSKDCGDRNARLVSVDGTTWEDIADLGIDGSFMIRAFVTNEDRSIAASIDPSTRGLSFKKYNIYRGTSLDNIEWVGDTKDKTYFDEVEKGTYYYQVKAVYEENGIECESAAAKTYNNVLQDYVVVEVTAINENGVDGMMIYPNPTNGNLNINVKAMKRISIANAMGQVVYDNEVADDNVTIDMAQYKTGIYMVRVVTENGVAVERISVVR